MKSLFGGGSVVGWFFNVFPLMVGWWLAAIFYCSMVIPSARAFWLVEPGLNYLIVGGDTSISHITVTRLVAPKWDNQEEEKNGIPQKRPIITINSTTTIPKTSLADLANRYSSFQIFRHDQSLLNETLIAIGKNDINSSSFFVVVPFISSIYQWYNVCLSFTNSNDQDQCLPFRSCDCQCRSVNTSWMVVDVNATYKPLTSSTFLSIGSDFAPNFLQFAVRFGVTIYTSFYYENCLDLEQTTIKPANVQLSCQQSVQPIIYKNLPTHESFDIGTAERIAPPFYVKIRVNLLTESWHLWGRRIVHDLDIVRVVSDNNDQYENRSMTPSIDQQQQSQKPFLFAKRIFVSIPTPKLSVGDLIDRSNKIALLNVDRANQLCRSIETTSGCGPTRKIQNVVISLMIILAFGLSLIYVH